MSDDPPGLETRGEVDLPDGERLVGVEAENPLPPSADLAAAQFLAEYDSQFGLHEPEYEWLDPDEAHAGFTDTATGSARGPGSPQLTPGGAVHFPTTTTGTTYEDPTGPVTAEWDGATPSLAGREQNLETPTSEADFHYQPRNEALPNMRGEEGYEFGESNQGQWLSPQHVDPREIGEGPPEFRHPDWNEENWEDQFDDGTPEYHESLQEEEEAAFEAGHVPLHFFAENQRDIEIFWRWVAGMSDEQATARATGWLRAKWLLYSVRDQLRRRGEVLQQTWESAADGVSASNAFMTKVDDSIAALDRWEWVAGRHRRALLNVANAIRTAQDQLGPLYAHYRVARTLLDNWQEIRSSNDAPYYADDSPFMDRYQLPPIGDMDGQELISERQEHGGGNGGINAREDARETLRINDPNDGWDPSTTPVLHSQGNAIELSPEADGNSYTELKRYYHNRAAEIVQPLADTYYNEHLMSLTRVRRWDGPTPAEVGIPNDPPDVDPQAFMDRMMDELGGLGIPGSGAGGGPGLGAGAGLGGGPGVGPGIGPGDTPSIGPAGLPAGGPDGSMPIAPAMPGAQGGAAVPAGGILAGAPGGLRMPTPLSPSFADAPGQPPVGLSAGAQAAFSGAGAQAAGATAQAASLRAAATAAERAAAATMSPSIAVGPPPAAGAQAPFGLGGAAAPPAGQVALPGIAAQNGAVPSGGGLPPTGAAAPPAGQVALPGIATPDGTLPTAGAAGDGQPTTGVAASQQPASAAGHAGTGMMPPPPPPMMPPMAGQQQNRPGAQGSQPGGQPPGTPGAPPPMFIPPGRTQQGRTPTAPQRVQPTLAGASGRPANRAGGLRGAQGATPAAAQPAAPQQRANQTPAPGETDRELWSVKKPKGVLQGSGPQRPTPHGKPIGSAG